MTPFFTIPNSPLNALETSIKADDFIVPFTIPHFLVNSHFLLYFFFRSWSTLFKNNFSSHSFPLHQFNSHLLQNAIHQLRTSSSRSFSRPRCSNHCCEYLSSRFGSSISVMYLTRSTPRSLTGKANGCW